MKKQIISFSKHQTAKLFALIYFILSFIICIPLAFIAIYHHQYGASVVFFILPFVYALIGYVLWIIIAFFYNFAAKYVGGIEFELKDKE